MQIKFWKTALWAIIVFIISSLPGNKVDDMPFLNIPYIDKIIHMGMYFILTLLFVYEINNNSFSASPKFLYVFIIIVICLIYGIILEYLQYLLFTGRSADVFDVLFNSIGCILAILSFYTIKSILL